MKKLFIAVILLFILANSLSYKEFSLDQYFDGELITYSENYINGSVDLGFCYANVGKTNNAIGESVKIYDLEVGQALKTLQADVVNTEYINGTTIIYACSKFIPKNVVVDKQKVNLQIAIKEDCCVVGWPLILGGF